MGRDRARRESIASLADSKQPLSRHHWPADRNGGLPSSFGFYLRVMGFFQLGAGKRSLVFSQQVRTTCGAGGTLTDVMGSQEEMAATFPICTSDAAGRKTESSTKTFQVKKLWPSEVMARSSFLHQGPGQGPPSWCGAARKL